MNQPACTKPAASRPIPIEWAGHAHAPAVRDERALLSSSHMLTCAKPASASNATIAIQAIGVEVGRRLAAEIGDHAGAGLDPVPPVSP